MTNIIINDKECWRCGGTKNITMHHTLPKHLKPAKNIVVPVCEGCHKEITSEDITGLYSYLSKMEMKIMELLKQVKATKTIIENQSIFKVKKKK